MEAWAGGHALQLIIGGVNEFAVMGQGLIRVGTGFDGYGKAE